MARCSICELLLGGGGPLFTRHSADLAAVAPWKPLAPESAHPEQLRPQRSQRRRRTCCCRRLLDIHIQPAPPGLWRPAGLPQGQPQHRGPLQWPAAAARTAARRQHRPPPQLWRGCTHSLPGLPHVAAAAPRRAQAGAAERGAAAAAAAAAARSTAGRAAAAAGGESQRFAVRMHACVCVPLSNHSAACMGICSSSVESLPVLPLPPLPRCPAAARVPCDAAARAAAAGPAQPRQAPGTAPPQPAAFRAKRGAEDAAARCRAAACDGARKVGFRGQEAGARELHCAVQLLPGMWRC